MCAFGDRNPKGFCPFSFSIAEIFTLTPPVNRLSGQGKRLNGQEHKLVPGFHMKPQ
jgi:hypothetical protein